MERRNGGKSDGKGGREGRECREAQDNLKATVKEYRTV